MKFRTEYIPAPSPISFDPELPVLFMGSCFSSNIGEKVRESLVDACVTPGGVCFNPASISRQIMLALDEAVGAVDPFRAPSGRFFSWDFPTQFGADDPKGLEGVCNSALAELRHYLLAAPLIIITFGTSWVYELASEPGRVVTNCHKQPQQMFRRRRMESSETASLWRDTIARIRRVNPGAKFIFTVSPVRHLKDGFSGNALSKASLLLAIERICAENSDCEYFPAYEIFMDDLRDYRFYADDLLHPSRQGVEYVWQKFRDTYCTKSARSLLDEGAALQLRLSHRPLGTDPEAEERFRRDTLRIASELKARHPGLRIEL